MKFFKLSFLIALGLLLSGACAQADFGNFFVANQRLSTLLNASTQKMSYRFTCEDNTTLKGASLFCVSALNPSAYIVSLQKDVKGQPSGVPLAACSYVPREHSWSSVFFDPVPLVKGEVYHLVIEPDMLGGGDHPVAVINASHYASFLSTDHLNHMHPNDESPDPQANTLLFTKGRWKTLNQEPVYAIFGAGTEFQGNPYDDPGALAIYDQMAQGEALHFHCGYPVKALAFRVKKEGHPTAPLNFVILSSDYRAHLCHTLYRAVLLNPDQASSHFQWVTIGIPADIANFPAECYYFVLTTHCGSATDNPPGCVNGYLLSDVGNSGGLARAYDLSFDGGPHLSREVRCTQSDLVAGWIDSFGRDANVAAIGPICPPAPTGDTAPLPTPLPIVLEPNVGP